MSESGDGPLDLLLRSLERLGAGAANRLIQIVKALDDSPSVCYILDDRFRFVHCNPAWDRFAAANGARDLDGEKMVGADVFTAIPPVLAEAYRHAFASVETTGRVWVKAYECSSPRAFRKFQMRIHALQQPRGFLVTNALLVERPHEHVAPALRPLYFNDGIITMCAHCRCSRRIDSPGQWDFVPEYLQLTGLDTLQVSHGLCPICVAYFYPDLAG